MQETECSHNVPNSTQYCGYCPLLGYITNSCEVDQGCLCALRKPRHAVIPGLRNNVGASSHVLRFNRIFGFGEGQRSVNTSASRYQSETDNKQPADTRERGSTDSC